MKKLSLVILFAAVLAIGFTSCSDKERCWEVSVSFSFLGEKESQTGYVWGTKDELEANIEKGKAAAELAGFKDYKVTKKRSNKSETDCVGLK
ncbi:MAG: hypothetical protein LBN95_04640 [Prevotellaceae bacterium]|jgi:hypothetical protein|nr:hypothetical protein [Prevotellaceae bacterium]